MSNLHIFVTVRSFYTRMTLETFLQSGALLASFLRTVARPSSSEAAFSGIRSIFAPFGKL